MTEPLRRVAVIGGARIPFARTVAMLAKQLAERGSGRGLISICTAGGMGVSAILER